MAVTKTTYTQSGSTTQYAVPFEVIAAADIDVYLDGVLQLQQNTTSTADPTHPQVISGEISQGTSLTNYTVASNNATITFNAAPTTGAFIILERTTDDTLLETFVSGSTVRAADLNSAFERVLFIAQEGVSIAEESLNPSETLDDAFDAKGSRVVNVGNATEDTDAVNRAQLGKVITDDLLEGEAIDLSDATGGTNSNKQVTISVEDSSKTNKGAVSINEGEGIDVTYTNGNAVIAGEDSSKTNKGIVTINEGHAIGVTYTSGDAVIAADKSTASQQGVVQISSTTPIQIDRAADGEVALSIPDDTVDLAKIKAEDIRTLAEQNATPNATGSDDEIGTTAANDKRYDTVYQTGTPSGTDWPVGKFWYDHANDQTLSVWSGSNWLSISSGGTFVTQPTVIWVDQANGDDSNDGHRIIDSMKTIKAAVASADHGDIVLVAPGVYREAAPIDVTVNNLSIIGQSLRSCFIHPTPATEETTLFRVNSGTQIANFSFGGLKASGQRGGHAIDTDSTYGLPSNQAFVAEFYPNAVIYKSPYLQNCTNFADSGIYNHTEAEYNANNSLGGYFDPNNVSQGGFGGDLTSGPTGGGLLVDGSAVASNSPLRSMVVDSFTQIALDGPGILCCNNGYAQLVSFFGTFCHYHAKSLNGGQLNLSNCTTDYGRYGLIADGKSTTAIFTATASMSASSGDLYFTIGAPTADASWHGSATRPQDNMLVTVGSNTYPVKSATANGAGWDVYIENPDPNSLATNLGLAAGIGAGAAVSFFYRSYISTGGHTFEYVGSGTDYRADPANGGVPIEANQVKNLNDGKVWQSSTDHNGKFKVGDTFSVDQRTGQVNISLDAYRPEVVNDLTPELGGDLDVSTYDIVSSNNRNIDLTPDGTGIVNVASDLTVTGDVTAVDLTASGTVTLSGLSYPSSDGATDQILKTDGSGTLSFVGISSLQGAGMQNLSDDTTPQLGGELDALNNKIINLGTPTNANDAATKTYVDTSLGNVDSAFVETNQTLTANKTIGANVNAICIGPMAVDSGVTLSVGANSKLSVLIF